MNTDFAYLMSKYLSVYLPAQYNASENTILSYRDTFKLLIRFMETELRIVPEKVTMEMITRDFILRFIDWLRRQGNSDSTTNHRLAAVRAFFRYAEREKPELVSRCQEILSIPMKHSEKQIVNYISVAGIKAILAQPDSTDKFGLRDLAMLGLLYDSGARVSELVSLKPRNLRLDCAPVVTLFGKGRKYRQCPLSKSVADNLKVYLTAWRLDVPEKSDSPLFMNHKNEKIGRAGVAYIIEKYSEQTRNKFPGDVPQEVSPHMIRHSKAMHLLQADVNLIYIRDWLGHASVKTTEIYARADAEMKRTAIEKAAAAVIPQATGHSWSNDAKLMDWLNSLGKSNSLC